MANLPRIAVTGTGGATTTTEKIGAGFGYAFSAGVAGRALAVALVVGTILNLINQGGALLAGRSICRNCC